MGGTGEPSPGFGGPESGRPDSSGPEFRVPEFGGLEFGGLVDQHCHSVVASELGDAAFASLLTESDRLPADPRAVWDSSLGLAVRRWCAPELDLPAFAPVEAYLERRRELGAAEVTRRMLRRAGLAACVVDTGLTEAAGVPLLSPEEFGGLAGADVHEVVRIERVAERAASGLTAEGWAEGVRDALHRAARHAVGLKSVVAYRHGLDFDPARPSAAETRRAAGEYLACGGGRLTHPVLLRALLWAALETGLPLQLHTGFGDPDLTLHRADPSLLTDFVRAAEPLGTRLVLLHCWPYHRQAAWLAHAFPHVFCDVGLTLTYTGTEGARRVLAETLELAPFRKVMFSTDGYGLPELHRVGAAAFRDALAGWLSRSVPDAVEAARIAALVGGENARGLYGLPLGPSPA